MKRTVLASSQRNRALHTRHFWVRIGVIMIGSPPICHRIASKRTALTLTVWFFAALRRSSLHIFFFSLFWNKVAIVVWPLEIDSSTGNWYPRQSHIGNVEDSIKMVRCSKILNVYIRVHILLDVTGRQQRYLTSQV